MENRPLLKKTDIILVAVLLAFALIVSLPTLLSKDDRLTAVITENGETIRTINDLSNAEDETIEINGAVIIVKDGEIGFTENDCEDKICVKSGMLSKKGDTAACVPKRIVITVSGGSDDVDAIAF